LWIEHEVETLVGQRVFGVSLGYEDLIDHDQLRHDPVMAILAGKLEARREDCAPVAGKSTLNRLELCRPEPTRYDKISHDGAMIEALLIDLFAEAHGSPPKQIILDLEATDDPLHGHQEGRFFHGYYDGYCYLPLYVFCGRHLLAAKLRKADIDASAVAVEEVVRIVAQIRASWPNVRILLRADSGFAREALMAWCEDNRVDYLFGLARNPRLAAMIESELAAAKSAAEASGKPARRFKEFPWSTLKSWSRQRRVIAKAEWTHGEANPRFIVTSLKPEEAGPRRLYEKLYCARGDMENRIRSANSTCSPTAPRPRPCAPIRCVCGSPPSPTFSSAPCAASPSSTRAKAHCATIRLKLKIGALVRISVRRIKLAMASSFPNQREYRTAHARLAAAARSRTRQRTANIVPVSAAPRRGRRTAHAVPSNARESLPRHLSQLISALPGFQTPRQSMR
jgi:hypothetical protein